MTIRTLSPMAADILKSVLGAMQNAEELGGTSDIWDYLDLLEAIEDNISERRRTVIANEIEALQNATSKAGAA